MDFSIIVYAIILSHNMRWSLYCGIYHLFPCLLYTSQVFRDSFFHADMHPGNIFVSYEHPENPKYIGIDCGIVGSLNNEDKRLSLIHI